MNYTFSGFTAGMPTPQTYFGQIIGYIPNTLDFLVEQLNRPIIIIFVAISTVLGFLLALRKR